MPADTIAGYGPLAGDLERPTPVGNAGARAHALPRAAGRRRAGLCPRRCAPALFGGYFLCSAGPGAFVLPPGNGFVLFADVSAGASRLSQRGGGLEQQCNRYEKTEWLYWGLVCQSRAAHW